jgi:hypothetical protein
MWNQHATQGPAVSKRLGNQARRVMFFSIFFLSVLVLLARATPPAHTPGLASHCSGFSGQASGLCRQALVKGCFGAEGTPDKCEDLKEIWETKCSTCEGIAPWSCPCWGLSTGEGGVVWSHEFDAEACISNGLSVHLLFGSDPSWTLHTEDFPPFYCRVREGDAASVTVELLSGEDVACLDTLRQIAIVDMIAYTDDCALDLRE